jgi:hypothetical protein
VTLGSSFMFQSLGVARLRRDAAATDMRSSSVRVTTTTCGWDWRVESVLRFDSSKAVVEVHYLHGG